MPSDPLPRTPEEAAAMFYYRLRKAERPLRRTFRGVCRRVHTRGDYEWQVVQVMQALAAAKETE